MGDGRSCVVTSVLLVVCVSLYTATAHDLITKSSLSAYLAKFVTGWAHGRKMRRFSSARSAREAWELRVYIRSARSSFELLLKHELT